MATPTYDGKGQPRMTAGWFSGLTTWWNNLTPQYVTHAPRGINSAPHPRASLPSSSAGTDALAGAPPVEPSTKQPDERGADPKSAPSATKP